MNAVIFLDIDGVVTSSRDNGFRDFNLHVIHWLRFCCAESGAKIVLSSTWRHSHDKAFWQTIFSEHVHDDWATPSGKRQMIDGHLKSPLRGDEIMEWLDRNPDVTKYVILDDDSDFYDKQMKHFIRTDAHNGMLFDSFLDLRDKLQIRKFPDADAEIYQHPNMFGTTRSKEVGKHAINFKD